MASDLVFLKFNDRPGNSSPMFHSSDTEAVSEPAFSPLFYGSHTRTYETSRYNQSARSHASPIGAAASVNRELKA